ncbi:MAG: alkaline phosphatase family protein [Gemmatimonas sp.]
MTVRPRSRQRLHSRALLWPLLALLAACTPRGPVASAADANSYASRVVFALDGVNYSDIVDARKHGLFSGFRAPSRLISTFPSISDIAWHEILGVLPPRGYQRMYYSNAQEVVVGESLDAIKPIEFEERMDMAFDTKFHHLGAYLISNRVARGEVDTDVRDFFQFHNQKTVYIYNVGPDALQHTKGDLGAYLRHLDQRLAGLQTEYRRRTGRELEVVMLSDHGHNKFPGGKFVPIEKTLKSNGFHIVREIRARNDVAFSVDGVTTGFGVFCATDSVSSVAKVLANMEGVELVSAKLTDSTFDVMRGTLRGRIDARYSTSGDTYRYVPQMGDPLQFAPIIATMRAEHALDADGFADMETWKRYTMTAEFPVAVPRIVRGHTVVTLNPAPILVSTFVNYRIGLGLASVTDRLLSLGGTHGSLSTPSSVGVLMTNFRDTHDDITTTVRAQLDNFSDLGAVQYKKSGGRLSSGWLFANDPRGPFRNLVDVQMKESSGANKATALEVWLTPKQLAWSRDAGAFRVQLRSVNTASEFGQVVAAIDLPMHADTSQATVTAGWRSTTDRLRAYVLWSDLRFPALAPRTAYDLRVLIDRKMDQSPNHTGNGGEEIASFRVYTDAEGRLWPY